MTMEIQFNFNKLIEVVVNSVIEGLISGLIVSKLLGGINKAADM